MPMTATTHAAEEYWSHSQTFKPTAMDVKEEELSDSEYIPDEIEDEEEVEVDNVSASQLCLRSRRITLHSPPPVQQPWELNTRRRSPLSPTPTTHITNRKVRGDPRKDGGGCKRKRIVSDGFRDGEKSLVRNQVQEIQANLGAEYPMFVKSMIRSNVSSWFCLSLPKQFCNLHLPLHDVTLTLEVESGEKYRTTFLAGRRALSAGWRKFSTANKLLVDDLLVFHLIRPLKFKVYIMGRRSLAEVDAAFNLLKLNACTKQEMPEKNHSMPRPRDVYRGNIQKTTLTSDTKAELVDNHYEMDNEELGSKSLKKIRFRVPAAEFGDVRGIENFNILVNGVTIDARLSEQLRTNYYHLCCSQKSFLHGRLLKSINSKLAAEIIAETTKIANAIRAPKLSTSHADYEMWEKTLSAFELLGMNVGFLRARLKQLLPSLKSEEAIKLKRNTEAKLEQICARKVMRAVDSKLLELKELILSVDAKIEALKEISEGRELIFQEEIGDLW